ncbi:deadenylation-dependent mRNA-decapping factor PAT1 [Lachancea thermotolerans CBS 6340]|uniref:KLTH0A06974p n=1 Tax=Lachancea thermotolerans (strain ATCC 56472 / CBS 6340 / NRRL Y-8284) TaxID=559295 RepID=C5DC12_LACTC|nr:KLTH0A06974p [Lachancea thermotolerans CBS 6340]CAR21319.1 KLTH0A06974p [Lachancea thermotolerans CBS 6340]
MSFFGFDSSLPNQGKGGGREKRTATPDKPLDFDETYQGLGEYQNEEDDYLNNETFGNATDLGTDFDFGYGKGELSSNSAPSAAQVDHGRSYASAATTGPVVTNPGYVAAAPHSMDEGMDFTPMESLWTNQPMMMQHPQQPQHPQVLSMEELERQQQQQQIGVPHGQQQGYMGMPPMPPMGYGYAPQAFMPQAQVMPGAAYPSAPQGMPPQGLPLPPQGMPPQSMPPPGMVPPQYQQHAMAMQQQPGAHQQAVQQVPSVVSPLAQQELQQSPHLVPKAALPASAGVVSDFATPSPPHLAASKSASGQARLASPSQMAPSSQDSRESTPRGTRRGSMRKHQEPLSQDDFKRLQVRQAKVDKILRHSGVMTPRDKDFITRYQLSQIVTDDPYNEDFYFQVYKIIQRGGIVGESNKGLIARAYLEHSGHRLGGRYKRADVALQRMQSQVEKAVTVAKERPQKNRENFDGAKEGVLGKISSAKNSKAPRRQLQIPQQRDEDEDLGTSAIEDVVESLNGVDISSSSRARRRSSYAFRSVDQRAVLSRSGGRKFVLSLIETVYAEVLDLEALLRSGKETDSTHLWESLHIADDAYEVSPFISILSFDKGVKIMPRIFNFLNKEQKLKLLYCFFSELSHLNIIVTSSYKTNPDPSDSQLKKIELFQSVFLKIIVSFLSSSAEFLEVLGLLLALVKNNNVSFISTSKIGLNLVTVLISRAALIKQDVSRGSVLSSVEASSWNEIYDKLFTALETKLAAVFPPEEYTSKVVATSSNGTPTSATVGQSSGHQFYDQSYIWQFLASLALSGKLNHQRVIIDEIREEIFGTISRAEQLVKNVPVEEQQIALYQRDKLYQDLNLFLNVMGLVARDGEISELK